MAFLNKITPTTIIPTSDCHDCGGRCVLNAHVAAGQIKRIETDSGQQPQYRACAKGRAYRQMVYAPERLRFPLKRAGRRGSGQFKSIPLDEALDTVAAELERVRHKYGPASVLLLQGSGNLGILNGIGEPIRHVLMKSGGCTTRWGSPSAEGSRFASLASFGTLATAHSRDDLLNSRLIIMWGWNPAVSLHGVNTKIYLARAKECGIKIIAVDPRYSDSAALFADKWLPIRPGTDTAALAAMAYVTIERGLSDTAFIRRCVHGFEAYQAYLFGEDDGIHKTPEWAEEITGVAAGSIRELAADYAVTKPAALMTGYAPGRTMNGEQFHRAATALAAITGNIGIPGGNPAGHGLIPGIRLPAPANPLEPATAVDDSLDPAFKSQYRIHGAELWKALTAGRSGGYPADFHFVYVVGANPLNQYPNSNAGMKALERPEFIVVQDQFLSTTARWADIVLPVSSHVEHDDIYKPSYPEYYFSYINKAIEPPDECLSDADIARELARRLGTDFYEGKPDDTILDNYCDLPRIAADIDGPDKLKRDGIIKLKPAKPVVAFAEETRDPEHHPFPTPSGKIEIYSRLIAGLDIPTIPPVPKYIEPDDGQRGGTERAHPLQLISAHSWRRANSCFDKVPWLMELEPQAVSINSRDATTRGITDGDMVRVFNSRGEMRIRTRITERIMPGVVNIPEGAWLELDGHGVDNGGCPNILTTDRPSTSGAYPYYTCSVEIQKL